MYYFKSIYIVYMVYGLWFMVVRGVCPKCPAPN